MLHYVITLFTPHYYVFKDSYAAAILPGHFADDAAIFATLLLPLFAVMF